MSETVVIKNRYSGEVVHTGKPGQTLRHLVEQEKINLRDACLQGANLQRADLQGANLRGANLRGANLRGANLRGACLQGANLQRADLQGANLQRADLQGANLQRAAFGGGKPGEGLTPQMLGLPPADPAFTVRVARAALVEGALEMDTWHSGKVECGTACGTAHCVAGWAVHLAGPAGWALEKVTSPSCAGALLVPDLQHLFYLTDDDEEAQVRAELQAIVDADDARIAAEQEAANGTH